MSAVTTGRMSAVTSGRMSAVTTGPRGTACEVRA